MLFFKSELLWTAYRENRKYAAFFKGILLLYAANIVRKYMGE